MGVTRPSFLLSGGWDQSLRGEAWFFVRCNLLASQQPMPFKGVKYNENYGGLIATGVFIAVVLSILIL